MASLHFTLDAASGIDDRGGRFHSLFQMAAKTMLGEHRDGVGEITWRGHTFHYFEPWILDHSHTMKGMQYLSAVAAEMVDLSAAAQKENGMIWSFAFPDEGPAHGYHYWAYKDQGYAKVDGGVLFARQPVENHNESNFVDALYLAWKANGDDRWMVSHLDAARNALEYSVTDPARWSQRFSLLKRGYTIDSWDFQPSDKYLVNFPLANANRSTRNALSSPSSSATIPPMLTRAGSWRRCCSTPAAPPMPPSTESGRARSAAGWTP